MIKLNEFVQKMKHVRLPDKPEERASHKNSPERLLSRANAFRRNNFSLHRLGSYGSKSYERSTKTSSGAATVGPPPPKNPSPPRVVPGPADTHASNVLPDRDFINPFCNIFATQVNLSRGNTSSSELLPLNSARAF